MRCVWRKGKQAFFHLPLALQLPVKIRRYPISRGFALYTKATAN